MSQQEVDPDADKAETTLWARCHVTPGKLFSVNTSWTPAYFPEIFLLPEKDFLPDSSPNCIFSWALVYFSLSVPVILFFSSKPCLFSLLNCSNDYLSHNSPWTHLRPCFTPLSALQVGFALMLILHKFSLTLI